MIYTRSPYYVDIEAVADSYEMRLFVWKGDLYSPPSTPTYEFKNTLINNKASINISNYINDILVNNVNIPINNHNMIYFNNDVVNVRVEVDSITGSTRNSNILVLDEMGIYGYTEYRWGRNFTLDNDNDRYMLFDGNNFQTYDKLILGMYYSPGVHKATAMPSNTIIFEQNVSADSDISNERTLYLELNNLSTLNDEYLIIEVPSEVITIDLVKECKHEPKTILFRNRWGTMQTLSFFKKSNKTIDVTRSEFNRKSYVRQINNYNVNGREKITLITGYAPQTLNATIKELLLSEEVYIQDNNSWVAINVDSNSLTYKTKTNDKLISYELTFIEAFNTINNV